MNKKELAQVLKRAADLMEVLGEGEFRVLAYRRAARALEASEEPLESLAARGFRGIRGIGASLSSLLREIYETGEFPYLEDLEGRLPPGAIDLFSVPGLGPKKIRLLVEEGITDLESLAQAAAEGRLSALPGFGKKTEAKLREAVAFVLQSARRVLLPEAMAVAEVLREDLEGAGVRVALAGSLRRGLETVGSVDLVVVGDADTVRSALGAHAERTVGDVVEGQLGGLPVRVFLSDRARFGTTLVAATGSRAYVEALGPLPPAEDEAGVFAALGREVPPPFLREPEHVGIELPQRYLERDDLKGLIHVHTTYSDGAETLASMAVWARDAGYRYMVVTDHSQTAAYAGGLTVADLERQWEEIAALNERLAPFRILRGIESDILRDGSLDYPDEVLAQFEVVVGSLHAMLGLSQAEQTERLLRALENPFLSILGHPSGRLLLRREGARVDWDAVLQKAAEARVIVELNASPQRLDLDWRLALRYRDRLHFSIGPDAHTREMLAFVDLGVLMANKAVIPPDRIVNTWEASDLLDFIARRRSASA